MTIYAANANGDWWEINENSNGIWIINTEDEDIKDALVAEDMEEGGDKFEKFIHNYGKNIVEEIKSSLEEDSKTLVEYQEQEEEEDYGDAMTSMDRKEYEGRTDVQAWMLALLTGKAE